MVHITTIIKFSCQRRTTLVTIFLHVPCTIDIRLYSPRGKTLITILLHVPVGRHGSIKIFLWNLKKWKFYSLKVNIITKKVTYFVSSFLTVKFKYNQWLLWDLVVCCFFQTYCGATWMVQQPWWHHDSGPGPAGCDTGTPDDRSGPPNSLTCPIAPRRCLSQTPR